MLLRDYQDEILESVRKTAISGKKRIVMSMATGAGKTAILYQISKNAVEKGGRVLILVHRRDLAFQTRDKFREYGSDAGIIMAGVEHDFEQPIQIASVWTYNRRLDLNENEFNSFYVDASLVLVDECHRSLSKTFSKVLENYEDKFTIGVTATPCRGDQRGLGEFYDALVDTVPVTRLIDEGYLVGGMYYSGKAPDMKGVKTVRGDWDIKELGKRSNTPKLVGDVVENWFKNASDRQTITFGVNRKHARSLAEGFEGQGIKVSYLDAFSPDEERKEILNKYNNSEIQMIVNVALFQEFLDAPITGCVVVARSTRSLGLWRQCVGRGLRPYPGKSNLIVLDHGDCVGRLGYVEDEIIWSLDGKEIAWKAKERRVKEKKLMTCGECQFIFEGKKCPECGTEVKNYSKKIESTDEDLKLVKGKKKEFTMEDKKRFYCMAKHEQIMRGYSEGWIAQKYKTRFGVWPQGLKGLGPIAPDATFSNWIRYQNIRYHKGLKKKEAMAA